MFKRLLQVLAGAVGTAIGGPIGGALAVVLFDYLTGDWKNTILPHLQEQVDSFGDKYIEPIVVDLLKQLETATPAELATQNSLDKVNLALRKLATIKSYYEFRVKTAPSSGNQGIVNSHIISGLGQMMELLKNTYIEASHGTTGFSSSQITFNPVNFTNVGNLSLNWTGAKSITASYEGFKKTATGITTKPGGTVIQIPPPTTGTIKPGTIIDQAPTRPGTTVPETPKPVNTTQPVPKPSTGTTDAPVNNFKPFEPSVIKDNKDNKKYWIIGGGIALAALLFSQK